MLRLALMTFACVAVMPTGWTTDFTAAYEALDRSLVKCLLAPSPNRRLPHPSPTSTRLGFAVAKDVVATMPIPISDTPVSIVLPDGSTTKGQVIVSDARTNLALVHVSEAELTPLKLAASPPAAGSSLVLATRDASNTLIFRPRMAAGKPSFTYPSLGTTQVLAGEAYQADWLSAPVVDHAGTVQGVYGVGTPQTDRPPTLFWSSSRTPDQLAMSTTIVQRLIDDWKENGLVSGEPRRLESGSIGIALSEADGQVVVQRVMPESAADEAGLEANDVVTAFNGHDLTSAKQLTCRVADHRAGDVIALTVQRGDQSIEKEFELQANPSQTSRSTHAAYAHNPLGSPATFGNWPISGMPFAAASPGPGVIGERSNLFTYRDGKLMPFSVQGTNPESGNSSEQKGPPGNPVWRHLPGMHLVPSLQVQRSEAEESIRRLENTLESKSKEFERLARQMQELQKMLKKQSQANAQKPSDD